MSVKLEKESIRLCETLCLPYCQTNVDGDVIVPDVKPDIQKILQIDSSVVISQKNIQTDKIYIQGTVRHNILYLPEEGEEWSVKAISANQEFNHSIDAKGAKPGIDFFVDAELEPAEFMLLNSRKLNIRSKVGILARLLGVKEMEIATGITEGDEVEVKKSNICIYNPKVDTKREIVVRERLEVPAGSPAISEILKVSAKACASELNLMDSHALVKGELKICSLYCPQNENCAPEVMEHSVAFQERLEIEGANEGMRGEVEYFVRDILYEVIEDSDGDRRILSCEVLIDAMVRAFESIECHVLEDAYGKKQQLNIERSLCRIEKMIACETTQVPLNEMVAMPDYLPSVSRMCECIGMATIENVSTSENLVTVSGYMTVKFLYLSKDVKEAVSGFAHVLPFSHSFEVKGVGRDAVCDARAEVEHISCTISADKALQLRAILMVGVKVIEPCTVELVSEIDCCEEAETKRQPSIAVYFVKVGDTLWDVAKKYQVSRDAITAANGEETEIMVPGKCIYIFK